METRKARPAIRSDTFLVLLDHQSGLFQTVKDISVTELRNNTIALAKLATLLIPVLTTASEPNGPDGPLMPEIHDRPHAVFVPRKGEVMRGTARTSWRRSARRAGRR